MVLITVKAKTFTFLLEPNDVGNDSGELLTLKARTVDGVDLVSFNNELCMVHIKSFGRGPLQCEQAIKEALA